MYTGHVETRIYDYDETADRQLPVFVTKFHFDLTPPAGVAD